MNLPIEQFMKFIDPTIEGTIRQSEIDARMLALRAKYPVNKDWIRVCLEQIPEDTAEALYVAFTLGYNAQTEELKIN